MQNQIKKILLLGAIVVLSLSVNTYAKKISGFTSWMSKINTAQSSILAPPTDVEPLPLKPLGNALKKISSSNLPNLIPDGSIDAFTTALKRQISRCLKQDLSKKWLFEKKWLTRQNWCVDTAQAFLAIIEKHDNFNAIWDEAKDTFDWYKSTGRNNAGDVLFTGYYLPLLHGKRAATNEFNYPIYKKPDNLVHVNIDNQMVWRKVNPDGTYSKFYDRKEIDWDNVLENQNLEIAFVDDEIEAFFMHIQGSGIIELEDGNKTKRIHVNYAAQNGHPYKSISKILIDEGVDRSYITLQGLRRYFVERPHEIERLFPENPSYIFFNEHEDGPYGGAGTKLVPEHSIAIDYRYFPYGAVSLFKTQRPIIENDAITEWIDFSRLGVAQDTGGAIRGPGRVDIYWGSGNYAEWAAGNLAHTGTLYFAVMKDKKKQ